MTACKMVIVPDDPDMAICVWCDQFHGADDTVGECPGRAKTLKEENEALRTTNSKLAGLLRKIKVRVDACLEDEANMGPGSLEFLQGEIDALLASTGGSDAQV